MITLIVEQISELEWEATLDAYQGYGPSRGSAVQDLIDCIDLEIDALEAIKKIAEDEVGT